MTATEILRRMLDERGVEWMPIAWNPKRETFYHAANGVGICADEYADGVKIYTDATITPEQAVEATLGRGTCHIDLVGYDEREDRFQCRSCDWSMSVRRGTWPRFNYCPNCGAKVVEPTTNDVDAEVDDG